MPIHSMPRVLKRLAIKNSMEIGAPLTVEKNSCMDIAVILRGSLGTPPLGATSTQKGLLIDGAFAGLLVAAVHLHPRQRPSRPLSSRRNVYGARERAYERSGHVPFDQSHGSFKLDTLPLCGTYVES